MLTRFSASSAVEFVLFLSLSLCVCVCVESSPFYYVLGSASSVGIPVEQPVPGPSTPRTELTIRDPLQIRHHSLMRRRNHCRPLPAGAPKS